ncbi:MAG: hypothetical protein KHW59_08570 [Clostridiales bacterium]|nr:hypothetical protein [Clostridiales bacterium]
MQKKHIPCREVGKNARGDLIDMYLSLCYNKIVEKTLSQLTEKDCRRQCLAGNRNGTKANPAVRLGMSYSEE